MKTFLEDLGRKIGETAEIVTNKAGEAVEIQKLKNQIRALERACERDYMDLGRTVYEHYKDSEVVAAEAIAICEAIQSREESIAKYEQQVSEVKGDIRCDGCGKTVAKEMFYCPNCGAKMPEEVKEEASETEAPETDVQEADVAEAETVAAKDAKVEAEEDTAPEEETPQAEETSQAEEQIEENVDAMKEKVADMAEKVREKTEDAADIVRDKTAAAAEVVKEKAAEAAEVVKEKVREAEEKIKSMTEE